MKFEELIKKQKNNNPDISYSVDFIEELESDILEFGDEICYIVHEEINGNLFYTDYLIPFENEVIENAYKTTLKESLKVFKNQEKLV